MKAFLKRLFWPLRPRNHREFQRFVERMERATAYGQEQQAQSRSRRTGRDLSQTMAVPPVWRKEGDRP